MTPARWVALVAAAVFMAGLVLAVTAGGQTWQRGAPSGDADGDSSTARSAAMTPAALAAARRGGRITVGPPIAAEAGVFRTPAGDVTGAARSARRPDAHPRTLATYRALREYPGAPPRVPHGLTADEFRGSLCNTCHERGGYSPRFGAYVPVTPHPEMANCLQCHATDAAVVGTPLPDRRADALCRQCHAPGRAAESPALDWRPAAWPAVRGAAADGTPPDIPHDLQLRSNCLACHMGAGAVAEIRTTHPERANCRQCHLAPAAGSATP
jgi:nitrate reductase (cytochrome), electron transfer subunit